MPDIPSILQFLLADCSLNNFLIHGLPLCLSIATLKTLKARVRKDK